MGQVQPSIHWLNMKEANKNTSKITQRRVQFPFLILFFSVNYYSWQVWRPRLYCNWVDQQMQVLNPSTIQLVAITTARLMENEKQSGAVNLPPTRARPIDHKVGLQVFWWYSVTVAQGLAFSSFTTLMKNKQYYGNRCWTGLGGLQVVTRHYSSRTGMCTIIYYSKKATAALSFFTHLQGCTTL